MIEARPPSTMDVLRDLLIIVVCSFAHYCANDALLQQLLKLHRPLQLLVQHLCDALGVDDCQGQFHCGNGGLYPCPHGFHSALVVLLMVVWQPSWWARTVYQCPDGNCVQKVRRSSNAPTSMA